MNKDVESLARTMREIWHTSDGSRPSDWNSSSFQEDWRALARYILENFDPKGAAEKRLEEPRWQLGPCTYSNGESGRIVCLDRQYEDGEHGYPILSVSDKGKVVAHRQDGTAWANPLFNLNVPCKPGWKVSMCEWDACTGYKVTMVLRNHPLDISVKPKLGVEYKLVPND